MAENIFCQLPNEHPQLTINLADAFDIMQENNLMNPDIGLYGQDRSEAFQVPTATVSCSVEEKKKAYVKIIEEPQPKALRFRYICEGRSAGSIPGVNSTSENKTYPTIKVIGYKGPAMVVVSCVTVDRPYRPHPHNLVGKDGCKKGICSMRINNDSMECSFSNLGIQCVKRKDVEDALRIREEQRIDPFHTGFSHRDHPQNIDLNAVRLCFQVFLKDEERGKFSIPLQPVVSNAIYDKKATSDLVICKLSDCVSSTVGGKDIILLCDKVNKDDIQIRFYEMKDDKIIWQAHGDFQPADVHKQVAISFKTPKYRYLEIDQCVRVYIQLVRPSDQSKSEPRPFDYVPSESVTEYVKRKHPKIGNSSPVDQKNTYDDTNVPSPSKEYQGTQYRQIKTAVRPSRITDKIKIEPQDNFALSPSPELEASGMHKTILPSQTSGGGIVYQLTNQSFVPQPSVCYPETSFATVQLPHMIFPPSSISSTNFIPIHYSEAQPGLFPQGSPGFAINANLPPFKLPSQDILPTDTNEVEMESQKRVTEPNGSDIMRELDSAELKRLDDPKIRLDDATFINNFSNSLTFSDSLQPSKPIEQMSVERLPPNIPLKQCNVFKKHDEGASANTSENLKVIANDLELLNNLSKGTNNS